MPKRLIDDSLLTSPSLAKCSTRAQDAFPRFILLMDDFGCAEANPRVLVGRGWPLREDVSETDVRGWLEEYVGAGMAVLWTVNERRYVFLTGWFGAHGQKRRAEYDPKAPVGTPGRHGSKRKTPPPPEELVAAVVAGLRRDRDGKPPGVDREDETGNPSNSTPARETTGNEAGGDRETQISRPVPVYAVAVPDAEQIPPHACAREAAPAAPKPRPRLVSPFGSTDPYPLTTAVLAALFDRGLDAAPPSGKQAQRVEAAIAAATVPVAVERLAGIYARPGAEKPLTFHVEAIRGESKPRREAIGDLGSVLIPWNQRLTREEHQEATAELRALATLDPDLEYAPLGIPGNPDSPAFDALQEINAKWRAIAERRS